MDTTARISPTLFLGAEASPHAPTVSGAEAWSSLAVIAAGLLTAFVATGAAIWFAATAF
jgi:hypothetical protein